MTAYNVVDRDKLVEGQPEDISRVLANFDAIASIINGQLDNTNVKAGAGVDVGKLAPGIDGQQLRTVGSVAQWVASGGTGAGGVPAGFILPFGGPVIPTDWLLCDGASVAVASYPDLHTAIGYSWGGSGANFNVPNLKGCVLVARDPAQAEFDVLAEKGGVKSHVLSASEMPSHSHVVNSHAHGGGNHNHLANRSIVAGAGDGEYALAKDAFSGAVANMIQASGVIIGAEAPGTNAQGGGAAHNNLQPFAVVNYAIKI